MEIKDSVKNLFEPELVEELLQVGKLKTAKEGDVIISIGQPIVYMPIVLEGILKVSMIDDNGKELLMYYLNAADGCAMTFTCCMQEAKSEIQAVAEEDVEMWMIPVEYMDKWMSQYPTWKHFVMRTMQNRFYEMLKALDMVAFNSLDTRLLTYLKEKSSLTGKTVINVSHEQIANDLASSRVVISRMLKKLENDGKVLLYRNQIKLLKDL
ncbi:Crp/Fnr family transcriptional regulator [Chryseobacterium suipulveris]|uniref:Crp/Fnr family transcriptional regulator n=1 Tax=Chryseobacterium suipulveris TaxID=2929800 RepID=A0ABY4BMY2_9FLAO|nr:Crp/Fnr family transcriptional regulator [Chryseobacterium suipulveris]UOE40549.1 Crp/Fnr family transcriptional regulator [Chryseobacterium suipulveris]